MRRVIVGLAVLGIVAAACSEGGGSGATPSGSGAGGCDPLPLKNEGKIIVGAEYPYYPPFLDGPEGNPTGYEADLTHAIVEKLGMTKDEVEWMSVPFTGLFAPGETQFDFDINEITITDERSQVVDFSDPYFDANQGLLVREDTPVASATTLADLKDFQFAAQANTTGLAYIQDTIQPTSEVQIFDDLSAAGAALAGEQVDAVVIDVPIAIGMTDQFAGTTVAGQFITNEQYGILFEKGSSLRTCVNDALQQLKDDGTAQSLQEQYFPGSTDLPVIQ
jgi:polar amino acid transport system substrate-binding protein